MLPTTRSLDKFAGHSIGHMADTDQRSRLDALIGPQPLITGHRFLSRCEPLAEAGGVEPARTIKQSSCAGTLTFRSPTTSTARPGILVQTIQGAP